MKRTFEDKFILFFTKFFNQISIKIIKPFFWTKCCKCGNEFKRESMLYLNYPHYFGSKNIYDNSLYGCQECFKDKNEFINYVSTNDSSSLKKEYLALLKNWRITPNEEWIKIFTNILVTNNAEK